MAFKLQLAFMSMAVLSIAIADDFHLVQMYSRMNHHYIRRDVNASIAASTHTAGTLERCSNMCSMDRGVSLYYVNADQTCQCNNDTDVSTDDDSDKPEVVYGHFDQFTEISKYRGFTKVDTIPRMSDCLDIYNAGFHEDGVYTIQPTGQVPVDTWCDMQNGGWTVFQRRQDGSEDFQRGWSDYVSGFGNKTGEYWLGLDNIHALTLQASEMNIYAEAFEGRNPQTGNALFSSLAVDGPSLKYRLRVVLRENSCGGQMFTPQGNNRPFSTFDQDNDVLYKNCAEEYRGGWWYHTCHRLNLNGFYYGGEHTSEADGVNWHGCWGFHYSAKTVVMKARRTSSL